MVYLGLGDAVVFCCDYEKKNSTFNKGNADLHYTLEGFYISLGVISVSPPLRHKDLQQPLHYR